MYTACFLAFRVHSVNSPAQHINVNAPNYEASPRYMYTAWFLALGFQYALQSV